MCPHCKSKYLVKRGFYTRYWGKPRKIQRFFCRRCFRSFATQSTAVDRKEYKSFVNGEVFRLLMSGMSQRRCARVVGVDRKTIARKMRKLADQVRTENILAPRKNSGTTVVFDELETFVNWSLRVCMKPKNIGSLKSLPEISQTYEPPLRFFLYY